MESATDSAGVLESMDDAFRITWTQSRQGVLMTRRSFAAIALAVSLVVPALASTPALAASSPSYRDTLETARSAGATVLEDTGATSLSMALVDGSRTAWSTTLGVIDESGTRPDSSTLYGVGSVSKMLTTIAVMQLVDAGTVSLDAPVADYVTDFRMASPEYRQITVRMLLDHSAGLPGSDYANAITATPFPGYAQQVLETLATSRLKTTPGSMSVYCNDCFTLAGILVERMSGLSYPDYVEQRILRPLGMDLSRYGTSVYVPGTYAPVITESGTLPAELTNFYATGGLLSTPSDMGRLAAMLMNGGALDGVRILSRASVAEMGRSQLPTTLVASQPPVLTFGLGWDSVAEPGLAAVGVEGWVKGGDTSQYHAAFMLAPDQDVAVIVLAAGQAVSSTALEALAQTIVMSALVEKGDLEAVPGMLMDRGPERVQASAAQLATIAGFYLAGGSAFRVTARPNGSVRLAVFDGREWFEDPSPYTLRSDGRYWSAGPAAAALGLTRAWGRTFLVLSRPGGAGHYREDLVMGQKVTSASALSAAWQRRLDQTWLNVNERPDSAVWETAPTLVLAPIPGLGGFLVVAGAVSGSPVDPRMSDDVASMFLTVPIIQGRDLNDLNVLYRPDGEWMRFGGGIFRPLSSVPGLSLGSSTVTISADGYAEWRTVPDGGTVAVTGEGEWKAFAPDGTLIGSGRADGSTVSVPAGTWLVVFGGAGDQIQVRVGSST